MDDKSKKGPRDAARVDLSEDYEVRYWTERFAISKDKLAQIVEKVGPMVKDIEKALIN